MSETSPAGDRPEPRGGAIYVVATPIGNLEDVTLRAIRVLREADVVAAEDTRRARLLLDHLGISRPIVSYYDAVEAKRAPELVRRALAGESIALISDAGTPLVADPGFRLVRAAVEAGVDVIAVPGPSAVLALLACAGLPPARFTFVGFLPARAAARRREILALADRPETLVLFEAPRRLVATLRDLAELLGARRAAVGRELTKRFEELARGTLAELAERFAERESQASLRGEVVLAVAGADARRAAGSGATGGRAASLADGADASAPPAEREATLDERIARRLAAGESVARTARAVAAETGSNRQEIYRRAVELREVSGPAARRTPR